MALLIFFLEGILLLNTPIAIAFSAKVILTSAIRVEQPLNIVGDSEQLYRLVSNLIINAIQYTPQFGKVTVVLDRSENNAVIQVQDTGIGIPHQELTRIFDRFYRVNSDAYGGLRLRSRKTGGSGLGLAIAQAIIQSHQGSLNVQSQLGKGSTFTIQLPLDVTPISQFKLLYRRQPKFQ
ncbi:GHKL domain-containing protein [Nostoc cf. edaphicum LEGE 07299]|uniref:histidine kinase n=1 Tax=Nostoc cf. edaphicum LEGE 07299 TaxID=2777974 RepID=A0ABR9U0D5_9NOSO|nr:GHKL domain-containing protein [Nostoc cf. edaphicum LEGE 07299]